MFEEYKEIKETNYSVSNLGNVKNHKRNRVLTPIRDKDGYLAVKLCIQGKEYRRLIHRLVAIAFIKNPDNLPQIKHKDKNPANNNVTNLEWCTNQYNSEYSLAKTYKFIDPSGEIREIFNLNKFCKDNNLTRQTMLKVFSGQRTHHKQWRALPK